MKKISVTLDSQIIDDIDTDMDFTVQDDFCLYAKAFLSIDDERNVSAKKSELKDIYLFHINAIRLIRKGDWAGAYDLLHKILVNSTVIPEPMMYFIFCDLEACCKELSDFKGAYEHSQNKIELFQKLLY